MKRDADRLELVTRVLTQREQQIAQRLAQHKQQLAQAREQLEELRNYYRTLPAASSRSIDSSRFGNAQAFNVRLSEAINQQEALIGQMEAGRDDLIREWQAQRQQMLSLETLLSRRRELQQQQDLRAEQKQQDEWVNQRRTEVDC